MEAVQMTIMEKQLQNYCNELDLMEEILLTGVYTLLHFLALVHKMYPLTFSPGLSAILCKNQSQFAYIIYY